MGGCKPEEEKEEGKQKKGKLFLFTASSKNAGC
jgi:hypothetical protein